MSKERRDDLRKGWEILWIAAMTFGTGFLIASLIQAVVALF